MANVTWHLEGRKGKMVATVDIPTFVIQKKSLPDSYTFGIVINFFFRPCRKWVVMDSVACVQELFLDSRPSLVSHQNLALWTEKKELIFFGSRGINYNYSSLALLISVVLFMGGVYWKPRLYANKEIIGILLFPFFVVVSLNKKPVRPFLFHSCLCQNLNKPLAAE